MDVDLVRRATLLAAVVLLLPPEEARAQVTVTGEVAYRSKYLFAGIPFAADDVTQVRLSVGSGALTLNGLAVWDHDADDVTEADLWGDWYAQASPTVGIFVGAALYNFRIGDDWEETPEVYGGLVFTAPLNPVLYVAHDFDLGDGTHAALLLSQDVPIGDTGATLSLGGTLDYNDGYYLPEVSGFSYVDVSASVGFPFGPLTIAPLFLLQRGIDDAFPDEELWGVTATVTF